MSEAGYSVGQADAIKAEVSFYENLRNEVKHHSADAIDLKHYEPAMRHLIDTYIRADDSEAVSTFDELSLVQLIVERGVETAVSALPPGIQKSEKAVSETIENNVRQLIIDETPINPKYYDRMSTLLDALIVQRKRQALDYQAYLQEIGELTKQVKQGPSAADYPQIFDTQEKRAFYDFLGKDEALAIRVIQALEASVQDDWRQNTFKRRKVKLAVKAELNGDEAWAEAFVDSAHNQRDD